MYIWIFTSDDRKGEVGILLLLTLTLHAHKSVTKYVGTAFLRLSAYADSTEN